MVHWMGKKFIAVFIIATASSLLVGMPQKVKRPPSEAIGYNKKHDRLCTMLAGRYVSTEEVSATVPANKRKALTGLTDNSYRFGDDIVCAQNNFTQLPSNLHIFPNLANLSLLGVCLKRIPNSIGRLVKLQSLSLCVADLVESIPDAMSKLTALEELSLSVDSKSRSIPDAMSAVSFSLESLSLDESLHVEYVPPAQYVSPVICGLSSLKTLRLKDASISELPSSINQLTNLETLEVANSPLVAAGTMKSIPEELSALLKLAVLTLAYQCITSIPESMGALTNLKKLDLEGNQITEIPDAVDTLAKRGCALNLRFNPLSQNAIEDLQVLRDFAEATTGKSIHF